MTPLTLKMLSARWFNQTLRELGDDPGTFEALKAVLEDVGASLHEEQWGLAGAVELSVTVVEIDGKRLIIEQETYIGVTIRGDRDLVEAIEKLVNERRG